MYCMNVLCFDMGCGFFAQFFSRKQDFEEDGDGLTVVMTEVEKKQCGCCDESL